ncbi:hypothetical protein LTR86_008014 [Recurvomyces mirabilis]|nr:hypothetical protein LTR86_008014 [Recurvomyces mirabilis]
MASPAVGNWAYAVPLNETNGHAAPPPQQRDSAFAAPGAQDPIARRRTPSAHRRPSDYGIQSDSEAVTARKMSTRASSASAGRKRSRHGLRESLPDNSPGEGNVDDSAWIHRDKLAQIEIQEMAEAGINVRQPRRSGSAGGEGGAKGRSSRSQSRSRKVVSREAQEEQMEELNGQYASFDDYRRKRVSTIPAADDLEREEEELHGYGTSPVMENELRTPEEVASEQQQQPILQQQRVIRPSTSRIPISKIATVPVPQQVVERDSPLGRNRHGSGGWHENWDEGQYARRARGDSVGSQVLLDEYENGAQEGNSPTKARAPAKNTPTGRKASQTQSNSRPTSSHLVNGNTKNRTPSTPATTTTPSGRPVSRSGPGHKSRPSTGHAHAPEGEAPWIASMYKPDPRLPPDQQMLPTHAKRLQQEQWEREGKVGSAYDRDFRVVGEKELPEPIQQPLHERLQQRQGADGLGIVGGGGRGVGLSPVIPGSAQHFDQPSPVSAYSNGNNANSPDRPWPLSPTKSDDARSVTGSLRPGTSGGYKITPTITDPAANMQRASAATTVGGAGSVQCGNAGVGAQPHNATPRIPDYGNEKEVVGPTDEEGKEKKSRSCGCCVVM